MKCPASPDGVKVHFNKARGLFYRTIGERNGKPWKHYLGKDETVAKVQAWEIWRKLDGLEDESEADRQTIAADVTGRLRGVEKAEAEARLLSTALTAYVESQRRRVGLMGSLGISQHTFEIKEYRVRRAIQFVGVASIDDMDFNTLEKAIHAIASRPDLQQKRRTGRISQSTAMAFINALREFCIWLADEDGFGWKLPRKIQSVWRIRPEPDERTLRTLNGDEIRTLWKACYNENAHRDDNGRRRRLFLLLGLNCGFYQGDVGTLKPDMFIDDGKVLWRMRKKTRKQNTAMTRTRWKLWPETRMLLKRYGIPSATPNQIRMAWERLVETSGVDVPFSTLRDTGAEFIRNHAGDDTARAYLGHSRRSMLDHYSSPSWKRLDEALDALRVALLVEPKRKKEEKPVKPEAKHGKRKP